MIKIDSTLQNVRKFNSNYFKLINEANDAGFQSMDDFYAEVKKQYAEQGIIVSEKVIKFIVDVFGAEAANNPQLAQISKNIFKNPNRFLTNVEKALGVNSAGIAQKVNAIGNTSNDQQVYQYLAKILQNMEYIENNTSATRSIADTQSADVYNILQQLEAAFKRQEQQAQGDATKIKMLEDVLAELKRITEAQSANTTPSAYDNQDLTGEKLYFMQGGQLVEGTTLFDSDSPLKSQDTLDAINSGKNPPPIQETLEQIQKMPHTVWIQSGGKVYVVKKSTIPDINMIGKLADFIPEATEEIKSILKMGKLFFQPISGNIKADQKTRRTIGRAAGDFEYEADKIRDIHNQWGMRQLPNQDVEQSGTWSSQVKGGVENTAAMKVINWVMQHVNDSGVEISGGNLVIRDGKMAGGVFTNKYFTIRFRSSTTGYDASMITTIEVKGVNINDLADFCKINRIRFDDKNGQLLIHNGIVR